MCVIVNTDSCTHLQISVEMSIASLGIFEPNKRGSDAIDNTKCITVYKFMDHFLNSNYEGNNSNINGDNTANYNSMIRYYHWYMNHGLEWYTFMMTSSNGNVTGHLCGEFTGLRRIPAQRPVARSFDVFFDLRLNKRSSKQSWGWWFETLSCPLWRHCNVSTLRVTYVYFIGVDEITMHSVNAAWKTGGIIQVIN